MAKIITIIIVIGALVGIFYFTAPDSLRFWEGQTANVINSGDNTQTEPTHERITAKHQYTNGNHIVAGSVDHPTPCYILTTTARVAESYPEQVTIEFVANTSGEMCAQVITSERFRVDFQASEGAVIKATWNGQPVELNLMEADPGEDLADFEIFIKG